MYTVNFFGGPKDGETSFESGKPPKELYCSSNESVLMKEEEFSTIRNFPNRSLEYFKYELDEINNKNIITYKYTGYI